MAHSDIGSAKGLGQAGIDRLACCYDSVTINRDDHDTLRVRWSAYRQCISASS